MDFPARAQMIEEYVRRRDADFERAASQIGWDYPKPQECPHLAQVAG